MSDRSEPFVLFSAEAYRVIGRATRGECHGNPALIHAGGMQVFDRQGRILLQLRSAFENEFVRLPR